MFSSLLLKSEFFVVIVRLYILSLNSKLRGSNPIICINTIIHTTTPCFNTFIICI
ncbi:hypothetical protein CLOSBL3_30036 [Clostridiaceae bacterium BL-3]|nr:hypothetical protein CLOSBL3_30036 [Clostridiaceae bacterium BL-3]